MNSIDFSPLYRNSIGFDRMAAVLNNALKSDRIPGEYPAYNIEVVDENRYAITLEVAGMDESDIDIRVENGLLSIRGAGQGDQQKTFLYQGIDARGFECKFDLAEYVEVTGADLSNGLLTIHLSREIPEALKPKMIQINASDEIVEDNSSTQSKTRKTAA